MKSTETRVCVNFAIRPHLPNVVRRWGSVWETITIELDEHNAMPSSRLVIRGRAEAAEIPGQPRWIADAIERHDEDKSFVIHERVTYEKLRDRSV